MINMSKVNNDNENLYFRRAGSTIKIEDFDHKTDGKMIKDAAIPYFKDIFKDLSLRSAN